MYNWLPHTVIAVPTGEPVTLAELKAHANILATDTDFDVELEIYRKAAIATVESRTGTKLITQTITMQADCFTALSRLPVAPLQDVTLIKYLDSNGVEQTLDAAVYDKVLTGLRPFVRVKPNQVFPASWCAKDAIRVTATAGYGADATFVPNDLRAAILLIAADWFAKREDSALDMRGTPTAVPNAARRLIANHCMPI